MLLAWKATGVGGVGVGGQLVTSAQLRDNKLYIKASFATNKPVLTAKHVRSWFVVCFGFGCLFFF